MDKTAEDRNSLHLGKCEKRRPAFSQNVIYTAGKSLLVVMLP